MQYLLTVDYSFTTYFFYKIAYRDPTFGCRIRWSNYTKPIQLPTDFLLLTDQKQSVSWLVNWITFPAGDRRWQNTPQTRQNMAAWGITC